LSDIGCPVRYSSFIRWSNRRYPPDRVFGSKRIMVKACVVTTTRWCCLPVVLLVPGGIALPGWSQKVPHNELRAEAASKRCFYIPTVGTYIYSTQANNSVIQEGTVPLVPTTPAENSSKGTVGTGTVLEFL